MKFIFDNRVYIETIDLDVMFPLPKHMGFEISQECYKQQFIKFTNIDSIEYIKQNKNIVNYNSIKDLSDQQLDEKINEIYKKLDSLSSMWLNSSTERRRVLDRNNEYNKSIKIYKNIYENLKKYKDNKDYYACEYNKFKTDTSKSKILK